MIHRFLSKYAQKDAEYYPVITITGPRQSGKTTLARATFPGYSYVSLEETDTRSFVRDDPRGFLARFRGPIIIDEVQRVPDLLPYIQTEVDKNPSAGRFVLTGSQNLMLMEKVSQTLAGRSGILHLLPFSRAELERQKQIELETPDDLFSNRQTAAFPLTQRADGFSSSKPASSFFSSRPTTATSISGSSKVPNSISTIQALPANF